MLRKTSYYDDWSPKPVATFHPVVVDGKHLGDVEVAYDADEAAKHGKNLLYAMAAVDEILPKYNPKTRIHELSITIEMPREDRIRAVISAVVKAMKLDEAFQEELSVPYLKKKNGA